MDVPRVLSNQIQPVSRKTRKIDFTSPNAKNISGLIRKALSLVRKVEEIDERKRALDVQQQLENGKKVNIILNDNASSTEEEDLRELREERRFEDLKTFIQDQASISSLIKTETSSLRDILTAKVADRETAKKPARKMIKALERLNSISSLLLNENDQTKSSVRDNALTSRSY